jgi:hypothetical protein
MTLASRLLSRVLALALLVPIHATLAQDSARLAVPFGVGERLEYEVRFGALRVGGGSMEVEGIKDVRGRETWHTVFTVRGGTFFYRVNYPNEICFDTRTGNSHRFRQELN